ncbi:hypothetical protein B0H13DRAFT_2431108 [Mycena leptocephala]|nr:hypothetical protein B0H13DRAFT_2431108 [Mycena leptocephala]
MSATRSSLSFLPPPPSLSSLPTLYIVGAGTISSHPKRVRAASRRGRAERQDGAPGSRRGERDVEGVKVEGAPGSRRGKAGASRALKPAREGGASRAWSSAKDAERRAETAGSGWKDVEGVASAAEDAKRDKGRQGAGAGWEDVEGVESAGGDVKGG